MSDSPTTTMNNTARNVKKIRRVGKPLPMPTTWTDKLAHTVKRFPCLYDPAADLYRDMAAKNLAWKKVGAQLGISGVLAKRKWQLARDNYTRFKRALERSPKDVTDIETFYRCFRFLDTSGPRNLAASSPRNVHLDNSNEQQASIMNRVEAWIVQEDVESIDQQEVLSMCSVKEESSMSSPERPTSHSLTIDTPVMNRLWGHQEETNKSPDGLDLLFIGFVPSVRMLEPAAQNKLNLQIVELIVNAQNEELS
ncbi:uncharacterized protein LOC125949858 [Anopheles darlingi]|uniref:uncharacterized protein LOC125949858 n=1 Tax=Anopheles darlingi TaxID=43151 RepID=UPI0020FFFF91|nr:uncharacterized protein LOC125949858 [Anopheles darlingi]